MEEIRDTLQKKVNDFFIEKALTPLLDDFLKNYDFSFFHVVTEELAETLSTYLPEYFAVNYHDKIGEYYFSMLYGEDIPIEKLISILKEENEETENGLAIYFADQIETVEFYLHQESIRESRLHFDAFNELVISFILDLLNNKKIII